MTIRRIIEVVASATKLTPEGNLEYYSGETIQTYELEHSREDIHALDQFIRDIEHTHGYHGTYLIVS